MKTVFYSVLCVDTHDREDEDNMYAGKNTHRNGCCPLIDCKLGRLMPDAKYVICQVHAFR